MTQYVSSGARLDRLPIASFHWKILALIASGALLDAFDVYLAGGVGAAMLKEGFSTLKLNGLFVSAGFFGMLIGAIAAGWVGDHYGRRASYQINLAIFGSASIACCFVPSIYWLIALRFIMGIGLGAELVVAAGTLCEFIPPAWRGRWTALLGMIINSGLLLATTIGYAVIPRFGWRYMFAIAGAGAIIIWFLRHSMPESPRWLESVGRLDEAESTLQNIEAQVIASKGPLPEYARDQNLQAPPVPISMLFSRGIIGRTLTAAITCVAINVAVYGFVAWLPQFFVKEGKDIVTSLGFTTLMAFGAPGGALVSFLVADRLGRSKGLITFAVLTIILGFIYPMMKDNAAILAIGFCLVTCIYTVVTLGLFSFIPELFPTPLRLRGTGVAGMCGRAASILTSYIAVMLYTSFGLIGVLSMVTGMLVLMIIAISVLGVDTRKTTLEGLVPKNTVLNNNNASLREGVAG